MDSLELYEITPSDKQRMVDYVNEVATKEAINELFKAMIND